MSEPAQHIEDVCWEIYGGPCPVHATLPEMKACDRKIRTCDEFVGRFREAVAALNAAQAKPAPRGKAKAAPPPANKAAPPPAKEGDDEGGSDA